MAVGGFGFPRICDASAALLERIAEKNPRLVASFTFLGHLFSFLPLESPAFRIHLLSGLLGALACGVLYLVMVEAGVSRWFSFIAALSYGVSEHFWSQSIIAEVYGLNALLCFAVLYFCLRFKNRENCLLYTSPSPRD